MKAKKPKRKHSNHNVRTAFFNSTLSSLPWGDKLCTSTSSVATCLTLHSEPGAVRTVSNFDNDCLFYLRVKLFAAEHYRNKLCSVQFKLASPKCSQLWLIGFLITTSFESKQATSEITSKVREMLPTHRMQEQESLGSNKPAENAGCFLNPRRLTQRTESLYSQS